VVSAGCRAERAGWPGRDIGTGHAVANGYHGRARASRPGHPAAASDNDLLCRVGSVPVLRLKRRRDIIWHYRMRSGIATAAYSRRPLLGARWRPIAGRRTAGRGGRAGPRASAGCRRDGDTTARPGHPWPPVFNKRVRAASPRGRSGAAKAARAKVKRRRPTLRAKSSGVAAARCDDRVCEACRAFGLPPCRLGWAWRGLILELGPSRGRCGVDTSALCAEGWCVVSVSLPVARNTLRHAHYKHIGEQAATFPRVARGFPRLAARRVRQALSYSVLVWVAVNPAFP